MSKQVDLQAVSIDPSTGGNPIKPGQTFQLNLAMKNNGPDVLPAGEATCQITLSEKHITIPRARKFESKFFAFLGLKRTPGVDGNIDLFFQSNEDMPVNEVDELIFTVKADKPGTSIANAVSSLSATSMSSDVNGTNQSVMTELVIKKVDHLDEPVD